VLREKLHFTGVVITDDLEMYGVHQRKLGVPAVTLKALEAGNDMVLLSHTPALQNESWEKLSKLIKEDAHFKSDVEVAARRILHLKLAYLKDFPVLPEVETVEDRIPIPEASRFFFESACRAVTMVRGEGLPFVPKKNEKMLLVGQMGKFFEEGLRRYPDAEVYEFPYQPIGWSRQADREAVPRLARDYDTIVFCLTNQNSLEVLATLEEFEGRLIVVSTLTPVYLAKVPWVKSAIAVYGFGANSFRAGFAALAGDFEAEGALPLNPDLKRELEAAAH
jgi:beta-N-acetylhexosaminidase